MKLGFLHIPRTGGTYLESLLAELGPQQFVNFFGTPGNQLTNRVGLIEKIQDQPNKVTQIINNPNWENCKLFSGHFSHSIGSILSDNSIKYFTILRNPIQRTTSFVKKVTSSSKFAQILLSGADKIGDDVFWSNFNDYIRSENKIGLLPHERHGFSNYMVKAIAGCNLNDDNLVIGTQELEKAKANLDQMHYVGLFENYEQTVKDILKIFDLQNTGTFRETSISTVPDTTGQLLREINAYDIDLYNYFLSKNE